MSRASGLVVALSAFWVGVACAQQAQRAPHIGYVYPGGAQRGTTVEVVVGGQFLWNPLDALISGEGVDARVVEHCRPVRFLNREQRMLLAARMLDTAEKRLAESDSKDAMKQSPRWMRRARRARRTLEEMQNAASAEKVELPGHPLWRNLEDKSLRELQHIRAVLQGNAQKRQLNPQIGESVVVEVTIAEDAPCGDRELRLRTRRGLTNPIVFQVGHLPEVCELEDNSPDAESFLPPDAPLETPVLINGQVMPGDVDRFRLYAESGQKLVIATSARRLVPYLADAVPGWFQATLTLYDSDGNEIAFADDYRFEPDPVLCYDIRETGVYELEMRDAIYRGREDFVYRISVGEQPYVTSMFPLGVRPGRKRYAGIDGWNLTSKRLLLDATLADRGICARPTSWGARYGNTVYFATSDLRDCREAETDNDTLDTAQRVKLPHMVDGRIDAPGDVDTYALEGKGGDEVVIETIARRVRSPLDSVIRVLDARGDVIAVNDDHELQDGFLHLDMGVLTHSADSYLRATLPADGTYYVQVADARRQGGDAFAYRVRISAPRPDFSLRVTPSSINVPPLRSAPICVYALRQDGFDGPIEVSLVDAPLGAVLHGARIPAGADKVCMTLSIPTRRLSEPVSLRVAGHAVIGGETITHEAAPADDVMQAFLYRHLAPAQQLLVDNAGGPRLREAPHYETSLPVRVRSRHSAMVRMNLPRHKRLEEIELELNTAPEGVALGDVSIEDGVLMFSLTADANVVRPAFETNLIIDAYVEVERRRKGSDTADKQRVWIGCLPALPVRIAGA